MSESALDGLLNLFEVRAGSFVVRGLTRTTAVRYDPVDSHTVHFVLRGAGAVQFTHMRYALPPGTVIVVPPRMPMIVAGSETALKSPEEPQPSIGTPLVAMQEADLVLGSATVEATLGGAIDVFENLWEPMVEQATDDSLPQILAMIESEIANQKVGSQAILSGLMRHLLIAVFRGQLTREGYRAWLWPAMLHPQLGRAALAIMARPQEQHNVEALAAIAGMSRSRFTELFTASFGRSPIEFLQLVRLRAARRLLLSSTLPVKSVAAAVGYASRSHFSRAFQAKYGDSPAAFRTSGNSDQS